MLGQFEKIQARAYPGSIQVRNLDMGYRTSKHKYPTKKEYWNVIPKTPNDWLRPGVETRVVITKKDDTGIWCTMHSSEDVQLLPITVGVEDYKVGDSLLAFIVENNGGQVTVMDSKRRKKFEAWSVGEEVNARVVGFPAAEDITATLDIGGEGSVFLTTKADDQDAFDRANVVIKKTPAYINQEGTYNPTNPELDFWSHKFQVRYGKDYGYKEDIMSCEGGNFLDVLKAHKKFGTYIRVKITEIDLASRKVKCEYVSDVRGSYTERLPDKSEKSAMKRFRPQEQYRFI